MPQFSHAPLGVALVLGAVLSACSGSSSTSFSLVAIQASAAPSQVAAGTTAELFATGSFSDGTTRDLTGLVQWSSTQESVAVVAPASAGHVLVTGVAPGSAHLTATYAGFSASTELIVTDAFLVALEVTPTNPSIARGTEQACAATGIFSDATHQDLTTQVAWSSSNEAVAAISNADGSHGVARALDLGTAAISATLGNVQGSTALTVTAAELVSIAVTPSAPEFALGTSVPFTAIGTYTDATIQDLTGQVTWLSSNASVVSVSNAPGSQGLATGTQVGSATITAALSGVNGSTTTTVTSAVLVSIAVTPTLPSIALGTTQLLTATGVYSDATTQDLTDQVAWSSSSTTVATISNAAGSHGLATGVGVGNGTISATLSGVSGSTTLSVTNAVLVSIAVTPTLPALAAGTTQAFAATGTYSDATTQDLTDQVTWSSSNAAAATISNAAGSHGLATGIGVGSTTVSAASSGVSGSTTLSVTSAVLVSIALTPTMPSIAAGTTQAFAATGSYSDATTQDLTNQVTWSSSSTTVVTISNAAGSHGLATGAGVGSSTISATLSGVSGSTALSVTSAVLVSIAVTPTMPSIAAGTTQAFAATGTYSDATTQDVTDQVTWNSANSTVATVSNAAGGHGLATAVGVGHTMISAALSGVSGSTALSVTSAVLVSIAVTPTLPTIALGTTQALTATGTYSDATTQDLTDQVTWSSSSTGVAAISNAAPSHGLATGVGVGNTTISAASSGVSGSTTLSVTSAVLISIAVTPTLPSLAAGTTQAFTATGTYSDATTQDVTDRAMWNSANAAVATVSNAALSHGLATGVGIGNTTISAAVSGVSGSTTLSVTSAVLVSIAVTPTLPSIATGTTQAFSAIGTYSDATTQDVTDQVTWNSSNAAVATVSNAAGSHGIATGVGIGVSTISAAFSGVSDSTALSVTGAVLVSIAVTPTLPSIALGTTQALTATGTYSDATTQDLTDQVTWSSSSTGVAAISNAAGSHGLATRVGVGNTTISATSSSVSGSTNMSVTNAVLVSIAVTPTLPAVAAGTTQAFEATGTYSDTTTQDLTDQVTWSSAITTVAVISNAAGTHGLATGISVGNTTISATLSGVSGSTNMVVTGAVLVSIAVTPTLPSLAAGTTQSFAATGTYSDATTHDLTDQVTWTSSSTGVATISNAAGSRGLATGIGVGNTTIGAALSGVSDSTTLSVTSAVLVSIAVTPGPTSIALGTTQAFTATGTYSDATTQDLTDQVTWSSSAPTVATISNTTGSRGLATGIALGNTTLSAALSGVNGSTTLAVTGAALLSIAVTPTTPSIVQGTNQAFVATGFYSNTTTQDLTDQVTWSSSSASVATISNAAASHGLATGVASGTTTISATLGPSSGSTTLTVTNATLLLIEVTPALPELAAGTSLAFTATGLFSNGTTQDLSEQASWSSSSVSRLTVSNAAGTRGVATGVSAGTATVSATLAGVTGSTVATVSNATLVSIAVTPALPSIANGTTRQFTAEGTFSDATTQDLSDQVTWTSSNTAVATVSNATGDRGLSNGRGLGTATITATFAAVSSSTTLTVTNAVLVSIAVVAGSDAVPAGSTLALSAVGTFSDATTQDLTDLVTWVSADLGTLVVSNAAGSHGIATGIAPGSALCSASFAGVVGSRTITVSGIALVSIAVTPANATVPTGYSRPLEATGTYSDGSTVVLTEVVAWTSSATAIATVSNASGTEGVATGVAVGSSTITAHLGGVSGSTLLSVGNQSLGSITVAPATASLAAGATLQMTATGTFTGGLVLDITKQVKWSSNATAVATVNNSTRKGLVTGSAAGTATIKARKGNKSGTAVITVP